jgi:G3E family GTPase
MTPDQNPLPITLLSGFLGAGKTTVLGELLRHQQGRRVAVIVNDMNELNIDADIARTLLMEPDGTRLVELQNGCICCTLRDDLVNEVSQLARSGSFDYLLIESTGISEPLPVAAAFSHPLPDNTQLLLSDVAQLDTLVTVVDGLNFLDAYRAGEALKGDEAERTLSDLLIEQIEFANVLLVSKADLLTDDHLQQLTAILQILNPSARIVPISHGKVDPDLVLGTCLYEPKRMSLQPGWMAALRGEKLPESVEYEIESFTWAARRPMHPERFWNLLSCSWQAGDVLRSKGFFWLATRPDSIGLYQQAGGTLKVEHAGTWWAAVPRNLWPTSTEMREWIDRKWSEPTGDRRQEIAFIGRRMDESWLRQRLDECLLSDEELGLDPTYWLSIPDPFPAWQ